MKKQKNRKKDYLDISPKVFSNGEFYSLRPANAKLLFINLCVATDNIPKMYKVGYWRFCRKYTEMLKVQERFLMRYMKTMERFFDISLENNIYTISRKADVFEVE